MQRFGKSFSWRRNSGPTAQKEGEVFDASAPPDVTSERAKSSGHGKKTGDKWNQ